MNLSPIKTPRLLLSVLIFLTAPMAAFACIASNPSNLGDLIKADAIVTGTITQMEILQNAPDNTEHRVFVKVSFEESVFLKGGLGKSNTLYASMSRSSFERGWTLPLHLALGISTRERPWFENLTPSEITADGISKWHHIKLIRCGNSLFFHADPLMMELVSELVKLPEEQAQVVLQERLQSLGTIGDGVNFRTELTWGRINPVAINAQAWRYCREIGSDVCGPPIKRYEPLRIDLLDAVRAEICRRRPEIKHCNK